MFVRDAAVGSVAGARARAVRVPAVRTAELDHETFDDPVKVQAVVEPALRELDEVLRGDRHFVEVELSLKITERGAESDCGVRHRAHAITALRTGGTWFFTPLLPGVRG